MSNDIKQSQVTECIIKRICTTEKITKGMWKNKWHYEVDIYTSSKRGWKFKTSFNEPTKAKLLKHLKEEYML